MPGVGQMIAEASDVPNWRTPPPPFLGKSARLTFSDDFVRFSVWNGRDGTWETAFPWSEPHGGTLTGTKELQWYVNARYEPTKEIISHQIEDGMLHLIAAPTSSHLKDEVNGHAYTSGMISSYNSFRQLYGYFELRVRLPSGKGLWPAFWLLPIDTSWPPEIDVLEVQGHEPDKVHLGVHHLINGIPRKRGFVVEVSDTAQAFHTFGVLWQPDLIRWFVDGDRVACTRTPAGLDQPMYMLANLAVGGWAGDPDDSTEFPARMLIDFIRVYQTVHPGSESLPGHCRNQISTD